VGYTLHIQVYDVVTALWKEVGNRYKNYVDFPKPNGYRSIHTTVQHQSGMLLEVQVHAVISLAVLATD
jgi:(p)ppGpp synthase/HD superfamily hydrolase